MEGEDGGVRGRVLAFVPAKGSGVSAGRDSLKHNASATIVMQWMSVEQLKLKMKLIELVGRVERRGEERRGWCEPGTAVRGAEGSYERPTVCTDLPTVQFRRGIGGEEDS